MNGLRAQTAHTFTPMSAVSHFRTGVVESAKTAPVGSEFETALPFQTKRQGSSNNIGRYCAGKNDADFAGNTSL